MTQEALKLALELVQRFIEGDGISSSDYLDVRDAIKEALAQPDPYKQGYADAMNWKVQNHLEHLPTAQPEQEPVKYSDYEPEGVHHNKPPQPEQEPACCNGNCPNTKDCEQAMQCLYTTPPQPEQEPVAYWKEYANGLQRDYDSLLADFQAQRTWERPKVSLTDDEIAKEFYKFEAAGAWYQFARAIEAKLKEKNT